MMAECIMPPLRSIQPPLPESTSIHPNVKVGECVGSSGGFNRKEDFDMNVLFDISKARWLNVSELCFLLDMKHTPLPITRHPPESTPPSGTIILYNRSFTRNYKEDHYTWVKKRNSTKVREDHVKLRLGGKYRVAGCYVHCVNIATMHRRAYHLLHTNEDGSEPVLPAGNGMLKSPTSLVLVHYLDTQVASVFASTLDDVRNVSLMNLLPEEYKIQARKPGSGRKSKKILQNGNKTKPARPPMPALQPQEERARSPSPKEADGTTYDDEALDILWSMVMEEGSDNVMQVLDNDAVGAMLESHASFGALLEMDNNDNKKNHNRSISEDFLGMLNNDEEFEEKEEDAKMSYKSGKRFSGKASPNSEDNNWNSEDYQNQWKNKDHSYASRQDHHRSHSRQLYQNQNFKSSPHSSPPPPPYNAPNYQQNNTPSQYDQYYDPRWGNYKQGQQGNNEVAPYGYNHGQQQHSSNYNYQMPYNAYVQSYQSEGSEPLNIPRSTSPSPVALPVQFKQRPLPDIVDFTPEHFTIGTPKTKVALSFSAPLPQKPDDSKNSTWHRLAVFCEVQITDDQKLVLGDIDLSPIHTLNPYSYRCNVPTSASKPGNRKIFITEVKLYKGVDPICEGILQFITEALQNAWENAGKKKPARFYFSKKDESSSIRLLTQLSVSNFELEAPISTPKEHYPVQLQHDPRIEISQDLVKQIQQQQLTILKQPIETRKRNPSGSYEEDDRHNKVRFVKEEELQSPSQPKLIQLLHVAQMNQNGQPQPSEQELTFG